MRKNRNNHALAASAFLAPSMVGFLLIAAIPFVLSFGISFTSWSGIKGLDLFSPSFWQENFVGLENYSKILQSKEFWMSLLHVGQYMVLYIPLMLVTSLGIAVLLNKPRKGTAFYRLLFYIPVLTSWVAGAIIWKWVLDPQYGILNDILARVGIDGAHRCAGHGQQPVLHRVLSALRAGSPLHQFRARDRRDGRGRYDRTGRAARQSVAHPAGLHRGRQQGPARLPGTEGRDRSRRRGSRQAASGTSKLCP